MKSKICRIIITNRSYLFDTECIVSFLRSRNIIFTVGAIRCADFAALPPGIGLHVDKDPLELGAVSGLRVTDFLRQRSPEDGWRLVNKITSPGID